MAHGIKLAWTAPTGPDPAAKYNVYRATALAGPFALIGSSTSTSYADTTGAPGTQYFYQVTAVDAAGSEGLPTATVSVTELMFPGSPTGVTIIAF